MEICLGSANFAKNYGIKQNKVNEKNLKKILNFCLKNSIKYIDTASSYNNVHLFNKVRLNLITKLNSLKKIKSENIKKNIFKQLAPFKKKKIYAVLIHDCKDMKSNKSELIYQNLVNLKKSGITKKIGISCYYEEDLNLLKKFNFDIIQFPFNIFDQRLKKLNNLKKLKGKEIHIRSIFLQGLLLNKNLQNKKYFKKWRKLFKKFNEFNKEKKLNSLDACFQFIKQSKFINKVVVGVDDIMQLKEILSIKNNKKFRRLNFNKFKSTDKNLILPINWIKK